MHARRLLHGDSVRIAQAFKLSRDFGTIKLGSDTKNPSKLDKHDCREEDTARGNSRLLRRAGAVGLARIIPIDDPKYDVRVKGFHRVRPQ